MKQRMLFYLFITSLVVLNSVLLSSPNLLGRIGLMIYKYHYLRTFPRTLLTVSIIVIVFLVTAEIIVYVTKYQLIKRSIGVGVLVFLLLFSVAILVKTHIDFTSWTYSHTGIRFIYGAYMLPTLLIIIHAYMLFTLPKEKHTITDSLKVKDEAIQVKENKATDAIH